MSKATVKNLVHIFVDLDIHFLCIHTQAWHIGVTEQTYVYFW